MISGYLRGFRKVLVTRFRELSQAKILHAPSVGAVREPPGIMALLEAPLPMTFCNNNSETDFSCQHIISPKKILLVDIS
jgi:hypothetical protein